MVDLNRLGLVFEQGAQFHAAGARALSFGEQINMWQAMQTGNDITSANSNAPDARRQQNLEIARTFAANRNEAVYGQVTTLRDLNATPMTVAVFQETGHSAVKAPKLIVQQRFKATQTMTQPRRRRSSATKRKGRVIYHDFTARADDYGLTG